MYETVKTINGYQITRMIGTHGCYHVRLNETCTVDFKTQKAAAEYIINNLPARN